MPTVSYPPSVRPELAMTVPPSGPAARTVETLSNRRAAPRASVLAVIATALLGVAAGAAFVGLLLRHPSKGTVRAPSTLTAATVSAAPAPPPSPSLAPLPSAAVAPVPVLAPVLATTPPSDVAPTPSAVPVPVPVPVPVSRPVATSGELVTPAHAHGHRVFVDGRYAAPSSGATLTLRCGAHAVRIGSKGRERTVDVPCGGSVAMDEDGETR